MKIVNIKITFKDLFSGATMIKNVTRSQDTFEKMQKSIGQVVNHFDRQAQIAYTWEVIKVEQK